MGTTASGYPFPVGTDRVMDGDDAIKALADKIEANLRQGTWVVAGSITINALNTPASSFFTWPAGRFTVAPVCAATPVASPGNIYATLATLPTTASVQVSMSRVSGTVPVTAGVQVIAIGA